MIAQLGLSLLLVCGGCSGKIILGGEALDAEISDPTVDPNPPDSDIPNEVDTGPDGCLFPPAAACDLTVQIEVIDVEAIIGEETVVQEVEVLSSGEVLIAGYFGLIRKTSPDGVWERINVPEPVSSSFGQLTQGMDEDLWACSPVGTAFSSDGGLHWIDVPDFSDAAQVHYLDEGDLLCGGDNLIGVAQYPTGPVLWHDVPALSGDHGDYWENNMVSGIVYSDGWYVAVERFGRAARAREPGGSWEGIEGGVGSEPELLKLDNGYLVVLGSSGSVRLSCDAGATWSLIGNAQPYPAVAEMATQIVQALDGTLVAAGSNGPQLSCDLGQTWMTVSPPAPHHTTYDVAAAPNSSAWVAGYENAFRLSW